MSIFAGTRLAATAVDARGRRVSLVPHDLKLHLSRDTEMGRRLRASSHIPLERTKSSDIRRGVLFGLLALPLLLVAALAPAFMSFQWKWPLWLMLLAAVPLGLIPPIVTIFVMRRTMGGRLARVYAHAGYCGSCGHDLAGILPEQDGCSVCPECGSAWRVGALNHEPVGA